MKVLGLDSSGLVAGVALIQDDVLIAEYTTDYKKTHSQVFKMKYLKWHTRAASQ